MKYDIQTFWLDPWLYIPTVIFLLLTISLLYFISKYDEALRQERAERANVRIAPAGVNVLPVAQVKATEKENKNSPTVGNISSGKLFDTNPTTGKQVKNGHFEKAEAFLKGLYQNMSDMDQRLKSVEKKLSEKKLDSEFALKMIEEILEEYDSLHKEEIKTRLSYLAQSLKE